MTTTLSERFGIRPSVADRERVADVLRDACAEERLTFDTLSTRLDLVYTARTRMELDRLVADVAPLGRFRSAVLTLVTWLSQWSHDLAIAWRAPRTPRLILPRRERVVIGRSPASDFVVADPAVSLRHATLAYTSGIWTLIDGGSTNGSFVNGWRLVDAVVVKPGDEVLFESTRFILAPPT